jgi:hypothetical protein
MGTFYDEIETTRARYEERLASYERTCSEYANRLRGDLRDALGWPDAQITLVDFDEQPEGARRASTLGHVSRDGFHFGVQVAGPADWHIVFYWTMHLLPAEKIELEGDADTPRKTFVVDFREAAPGRTEPLAEYVREKVRAFVRRFTLASLVETTA